LEHPAVIEKLTRVDIGILFAAAVMALGAFCPIVRVPIVGSINYVDGGRGDGVYIIGCSAAIIALIISGYRRTTGIVGAGALFMSMLAVVNMSALLGKAHADLASSKDLGPFRGLATLIGNSVGLEWGWLLLIGGALAVVVLALLAPPGEIAPVVDTQSHRTQDDEGESFSSADKLIADYVENRKISPATRNRSIPPQTSFGKRRAF
jgi:hypothetical protein